MPAPNGYPCAAPFPQLRFARMVGWQPIPGDGDQALLVTQDGIIRRANLADDAAEPDGLPRHRRDRLIGNPGQEGAARGLAFAPDYATTGGFYVYYTVARRRRTPSRFVAHGDEARLASGGIMLPTARGTRTTTAARWRSDRTATCTRPSAIGGSAGDPSTTTARASAHAARQDPAHRRVGRRGLRSPPDNPFAKEDGRGGIYAYGLRNPWRMTFRPDDRPTLGGGRQPERVGGGRPASSRVATTVGDPPEGAHCYEPPDGCDASGILFPRIEYNHEFGCSITGSFVYRGREMPEADRLVPSTATTAAEPHGPSTRVRTPAWRSDRRYGAQHRIVRAGQGRGTLHRHVQQRDRRAHTLGSDGHDPRVTIHEALGREARGSLPAVRRRLPIAVMRRLIAIGSDEAVRRVADAHPRLRIARSDHLT